MFDINLLARPGLQEAVAELELGADVHEEAILNRLQERATAEAQAVVPPKVKKRSRFWGWLVIIVVILVVAAYWWYQGWSWKRWREIFPSPETPPATVMPPAAMQPPGSCAAVMARFLSDLPSQAAIDFMDAAAGLLIYRIQGEELTQSLLRLNTRVEGHRFSDLITLPAPAAPTCWQGAVAFTSSDQVGALRPIESEYEHFFRRLKDRVQSSGGVVVETVPGTMTAGEYVLQGSLDEIQTHLVTTAADSAYVHYHRMSLLRPKEIAAGPYLLRVIFNIIEERPLSPRSLLPGDTAA
ncbi:MAG: hypothetical protein JSU77_03310 [Fidelibacterota bacterium]|nr:MAG: hypothetical protein JSU77_03310 [Candidatus Neomarinimicrobiota bacterium]